ncbi:hypothetical protein [Shewanella gaetbuli]|uniref:Uncharacterized protein n=1 Tax=Shewanella gaetbuli TaxID=220752 RepID=A0A9X1ZJK6_9GAMM|nr:hypothetical protein [Shewanella gaetbuli]MCL1142943.1 hypothetical protein [Shewanella gaetbuli]
MSRSEELLLSRVQKAWASFKGETGTNQTNAAKQMGMNQSAFSQYIRGSIPLNTDFLLRFGQMTGQNLGEEVAELSAIKIPNRTVVMPLKYTLSGGICDDRIAVSSVVASNECYLVENDYDGLPYRKGDYFIVDPKATVTSGASVFVTFCNESPATICSIEHKRGDWELVEDRALGGKRIPLTTVKDIHLITGIYYKPPTGRKFISQG